MISSSDDIRAVLLEGGVDNRFKGTEYNPGELVYVWDTNPGSNFYYFRRTTEPLKIGGQYPKVLKTKVRLV